RLIEILDRPFGLANGGVSKPPEIERSHMVWLQIDGAVEVPDGTLVLAHVEKHAPSIVVTGRLVAVELGDAFEIVKRAAVGPQFAIKHAALHDGLRIIGIETDRGVIVSGGTLAIARGPIRLRP